MKNTKNIFFGLNVIAPWPKNLPQDLLIQEQSRHITLNFIGNQPYANILQELQTIKFSKYQIGFSGLGKSTLFLPLKDPKVVAWEIQFLQTTIFDLKNEISELLNKVQIQESSRPWLPHLSICRNPKDLSLWQDALPQIPFYVTSLHLYESLGHSKYHSLWQHSFLAPFKEIQHTADIAFIIYGKSFSDLYENAILALSFKDSTFLNYLLLRREIHNLDDCIMNLNDIVTEIDINYGCGFKAVSFHSNIKQTNEIIEWEMIVDV